jgi:beta-galactosidase
VERLRLASPRVEVLAKFGQGCGWVEGRPAVARARAGKGTVTTLAGWFEPALLDAVLAGVIKEAGVKPRFAGPAGVEFAVRADGRGREVVIVMNHGEQPAALAPVPGRALLAKRPVGRWTLAARDVEVFVAAGQA